MGQSFRTLRVPKIIVIDGPIGAGKTTLIELLEKQYIKHGKSVCVILEPVNEWGEILKKFYSDRRRWAYSAQTLIYSSRIRQICKIFQQNSNADVYILERSPVTDKIFMEIQSDLLDDIEVQMYADWCDMHDLIIPLDLSSATGVYLKTSIDVCMQRLTKRNREGEVDQDKSKGVSLEYQKLLCDAHDKFFSENPRFPYKNKVIIDAEFSDGDFICDETLLEKIFTKIELN